MTTDIARRNLGKLVEMTSGAGAAALSISAYPRVFEFEALGGIAAREVYDVARPTATSEWDDSILSVATYLDLLELAWQDYQRANGPTSFLSRFRYMLYHLPFVSLAEMAHQVMIEQDDREISREAAIESFERMVRPSLRYGLALGNTYSGSLYVALAALIDSSAKVEEPGARVGVFSYGSGACAEFFGGFVGGEARATVARHQIERRLANRRRLRVEEYDSAAIAVEESLTAAEFTPLPDAVAGHFAAASRGRNLLVLDRVVNHHRQYIWS